MKRFIFILLNVALFSCNRDTEVRYYVPHGYEGKIDVIFDEPCGNDIQYGENKIQIYDLSKDGVLITKKSQPSENQNRKFFYKNDKGNVIEINRVSESEELRLQAMGNSTEEMNEKEKIGVYMIGYGNKIDNGYSEQFATISSYNHLKDFLKEDYSVSRYHFLDSIVILTRHCK